MSGADLSGADLSDADLDGVSSGAITGTPSALPANWALIDGYLIGPQAYLQSARLVDADLANVDLTGADLAYDDLSGADLFNTDLSGANLLYSNLSNVDLSGANLSNVNLSGYANLADADLSGPTWPVPICHLYGRGALAGHRVPSPPSGFSSTGT